MRVKDTANPAPMIMPLTHLFNACQEECGTTSNIVITSSNDESDFVDLHPRRKRQPEQDAMTTRVHELNI
jgi:hypothetical protein